MATCQLIIKIDEPTRPRSGGEAITGSIIVKPEKQVSCKGLVASCHWSTHGRGNIDAGQTDSQVVFEGNWQAGQEYSYPFRLQTAVWPPTYYGTYVNVGHYVKAQAKLSWAIDPKAEVEFPVTASSAPDDLKPTTGAAKNMGSFAWLLLSIIGIILLATLSIFLFFLLPIVAIVAVLIWFFRVFLPKQITGPVACELKNNKGVGGSLVEAAMSFTPQRNSTVNGVEWTIKCVEECSSGSGSNRRTHYHPVLTETRRVAETLELKAGQKQAFDFQFILPDSAPPSLKFSDNHVKWEVVGRIDIPKWPDFVKKLPLIVSPSPTRSLGSKFSESDTTLSPPIAAEPPKTQADEAWFAQVVQQIQQTQHDPDKLPLVIDAVRSFTFPVTATIEDEADAPYFENDEEFDRLESYDWWKAYAPQQNCSLYLAWQTAPADVIPRTTWSGMATIVGFDSEENRIVMEATAGTTL